jgi:RimJ/RimL family protein N-acetyltransferase
VALREHNVILHGASITLRPLTEQDWDVLLAWHQDPDVLYFSEGNEVSAYTLDDIQGIYREASQRAFCFMIEFCGRSIGEGWLQAMNVDRILTRHPTQDCRRIDLMIGEKVYWGRGLGSDSIRTLTRFGFEVESADRIYGLVGDYNRRSIGAFQKVGYQIEAEVPEPPGFKAKSCYDLVMTRAQWLDSHDECV